MKKIFLLAIIMVATKLYSQTETKSAIINIYNNNKNNNSRQKTINEISINDQNVATLNPNSILVYKFTQTGTLKLTVGSKFVINGILYPVAVTVKNFDVELGKEYHVTCKFNPFKGDLIELANEKEIAKLKKAKYKETINK
jgi:hypothetical protein